MYGSRSNELAEYCSNSLLPQIGWSGEAPLQVGQMLSTALANGTPTDKAETHFRDKFKSLIMLLMTNK